MKYRMKKMPQRLGNHAQVSHLRITTVNREICDWYICHECGLSSVEQTVLEELSCQAIQARNQTHEWREVLVNHAANSHRLRWYPNIVRWKCIKCGGVCETYEGFPPQSWASCHVRLMRMVLSA